MTTLLRSMPNLRRIFVPDEDMLMAECDLEGADAQVVAWEANDPVLKQMFRERVQLHLENMKIVFPDAPQIKSNSPESPYHKTKQGVHLTNYGGSVKTLARTIGITIKEASVFQTRWFGEHPWIPNWHRKVEDSLQRTRSVYNRFGFRRFYFDRIESILPAALAWIPQSTVAICTNKGLKAIDDWWLNGGPVELLLQTHDSLTVQFPRRLKDELVPKIKEKMEVKIPYEDPLIIPINIKLSDKSWGECEAET